LIYKTVGEGGPTLLCECFLVIEDSLKIIGQIEDLVQKIVEKIQGPLGVAENHAKDILGDVVSAVDSAEY
jgi:hypothetical protein